MSMARRRTRRKSTRRSSPKTLNVAGIAESALIANAVTLGLFNTSLRDFVMNTAGGSGSSIVDRAGQITARELIAGLTGGDANTQYKITQGGRASTYGNTLTVQIGENLKANAGSMVFQLVAIPAGFKVFKKLTTKPRSTMNKALKMGGLPVRV